MKNSDLAGLSEVPISQEIVRQLLSRIPQDLVLVGGQALAFWIDHYATDTTPPSGEDEAYVSRDADFLGTRKHVALLADIIAGKSAYPSKRAITILCGQVFVIDKSAKTFMNIDVIHRIGNMNTDDVSRRAVSVSVRGNSFLVMHPLDVLVSRVENYRGIADKRHTNGLRQIQLSIEVANQYLLKTIERDENIAISAIEKIAEVARSPAGIKARKSGAEIYGAINPDMLASTIKNENFISIRLPCLIEEIKKYQAV